MILRRLAARQGRHGLARASAQPLRRFFASEVDPIVASAENSIKHLQALEAQLMQRANSAATSAENSSNQLQSLEAEVNTILEKPLPTPTTPAEASELTQSIAEQYRLHKQEQQRIGHLGSDLSPHYQPHTLLTNPPSVGDVTLELLLASEAHQGHATSLWNPANARYIHGVRQGTHIISLEVTAAHLRRAAKVVQEVSRRGGMVLFVGTRDGQGPAVVRASQLAKGYHLFERWIPGSITNGQQILGNCRMKVVNEFDEEVPGFEGQLAERSVLRPDLVVCVNPLENYVLLHECALNNIPTIGVIDTNADPTWVTYPIPANDDSLRCIQVIAGVLGRSGEAGQKLRLEAAKQGKITFQPATKLNLPEAKEGESGEAKVHDPTKDGSIVDTEEMQDKLEAIADNDGRRLGHRTKVSA